MTIKLNNHATIERPINHHYPLQITEKEKGLRMKKRVWSTFAVLQLENVYVRISVLSLRKI